MPTADLIKKREQEAIAEFFNTKTIKVPDLPNWISDEIIRYWNENIFYLHYLPEVSFDENLNLPLWRDKPSSFFYKKINEGKINPGAKNLQGKWILIDSRDKPVKKSLWITSKNVWIFEKIGLNPKKYLKKRNKQVYQKEYFISSRFCSSIYDIEELRPFILKFLRIDKNKVVRLPYFIEYNYLGNAFYRQWALTETWEWLEDKLENGHHLASGSESVGCIGIDPPDFWSTILGFRPVIEL